MITSVCQRWTRRRCTWRPAGEAFDPRAFEVGPLAKADAKAFIATHHYLRSWPAARRWSGLFTRGGALVGVLVFSQPTADAVLKPWTRESAMCLGRLVLLDEVPGNAESFFVARCLDLIRREGFEGVVSFSDPTPRFTTSGERTTPGHVGVIYQAVNAVYTGRSRAEAQLLLPDATTIHRRALSKIRARDSRWRSAIRPLIEAGAPSPEDTGAAGLRAWLDGVLALPNFLRRAPHDGNHRYLLPLSRAARKAAGASLPYPRVLRAAPPACPTFDGGSCVSIGD